MQHTLCAFVETLRLCVKNTRSGALLDSITFRACRRPLRLHCRSLVLPELCWEAGLVAN